MSGLTSAKKNNTLAWHILGCIAFLTIPIMLAPRPAHMPLLSLPTIRDLLANVMMLIFFYLNYYTLIPALYFRKKHVLYGLTVCVGFVVITFLPSLLTGHAPWQDAPPPPPNGMPPIPSDSSFLTIVKHSIYLFITVVLFSLLLRVRMKLMSTDLLKQDAEINTLKRQINPHFLFNTLNNIYAFAIREKSPETATSILKLSAMMRYVVTETSEMFVPLEREINYTNDYIDLQKMRLTKTLTLSYVVTGKIIQQKIAPVVLLPFIENAFKHGVNPDQESYISIRIVIVGPALELIVENEKVKTAPELQTQSGVGIENTKARLELLYPKKYSLTTDDSNDHYRVKLNLELN